MYQLSAPADILLTRGRWDVLGSCSANPTMEPFPCTRGSSLGPSLASLLLGLLLAVEVTASAQVRLGSMCNTIQTDTRIVKLPGESGIALTAQRGIPTELSEQLS